MTGGDPRLKSSTSSPTKSRDPRGSPLKSIDVIDVLSDLLSCVACLSTSAPTAAGISSPSPSPKVGRSEQRPPTSLRAAHGRMALSRTLMRDLGRAAQWRDLVQLCAKGDRYRELAPSFHPHHRSH